jgi:hypothetical protein
MAYGGIQAPASLLPPGQGVPWETRIRLDRPVLFFAILVAAASTFAFGLFPALQSARRDIGAGTNVTGRTTAGRRQTRVRSSLVIAQVALSIVLLLGAGLLFRTFVKLVGVDLGFDAKNVLVTSRRSRGRALPAPTHDAPSPHSLVVLLRAFGRAGPSA